MNLQLAVVTSGEDRRRAVRPLDGGEAVPAWRSGPLTSLDVAPQPGQVVAIDTAINPPEIVHVYDGVDPAALTPATRAALERDTFPAIRARHTPPERPAEPDADARYMSWTGLAAQVWDPSGGNEPQDDHDYLQRRIEANGGPALDVGCGTGRLLLRYRAAGLDVDGLDPSADMLALCREKAAAQDLSVNLYEQSMHEMALPRRYRTIFIPCGTFCLLIDRDDALQALQRLYDHLEPGGELIFNLFWEIGPGGWFWREPDNRWYRMFYHTLANGDLVFQYMWTDRVDRAEQQFFGHRRYRLVRDGRVVREEIFPSYERVYGKYEIQMMLERTGFREVIVRGDWTDGPFTAAHGVMVIHGRR